MKLRPPSFSFPRLSGSNRPRTKLFLLGVGLYLFFLLLTAPAGWAVWGLNKITNGKITITQAKGNIWQGEGSLVGIYPRSTPRNLGNISWHINPLWVFLGRARLNIDWRDPAINGSVSLQRSFSEISVVDARLNISSGFLPNLYPPSALLSPSGNLLLQSDHISLSNTGLKGDATVQWLEAGSALTKVKPLGSYTLKLSGEGEKAQILLTTEKGDLQLNGRGAWDITGNGFVSFNGTVLPNATKRKGLEPVLNLLGRDLGNGRRLLRLNKRVPLLPNKQTVQHKDRQKGK